jgi:hypothetical protein
VLLLCITSQNLVYWMLAFMIYYDLKKYLNIYKIIIIFNLITKKPLITQNKKNIILIYNYNNVINLTQKFILLTPTKIEAKW